MAVKVCSNCNEQFGEADVVCKYCGQPTERADSVSNAAVDDSKSRLNYLYIGIAIVAVIALLLWLMNGM